MVCGGVRRCAAETGRRGELGKSGNWVAGGRCRNKGAKRQKCKKVPKADYLLPSRSRGPLCSCSARRSPPPILRSSSCTSTVTTTPPPALTSPLRCTGLAVRLGEGSGLRRHPAHPGPPQSPRAPTIRVTGPGHWGAPGWACAPSAWTQYARTPAAHKVQIRSQCSGQQLALKARHRSTNRKQ
ncbi:hypothetical protein NDU88_003623 [Pleurodeles waltl]|uniref:Uncharacterized protein n=1 Tax=Pleurodeles waltl TaxID=8319 RepID=A0AAV7VFW2_PLEWA|nr:hypothetical protein NDU88_003623 [Pleurodeles waltl]